MDITPEAKHPFETDEKFATGSNTQLLYKRITEAGAALRIILRSEICLYVTKSGNKTCYVSNILA